MKNDFNTAKTLVQSLNALSLDLTIHDLIQDRLSIGAVSDAEMIAFTARKHKKISIADYNALMFIFESLEDEAVA